MTISYLCVLIAAILPYLFVGYAKFATKGYDNSNPREFLDKLDGRAKRAHYAQLNSFETFPAFAAGVIIAHLTNVPEQKIMLLSVLFVLLRVVYGLCYIFDKSSLRSLVWFAAFICVITLYVSALMNG